MTSAPFFSLDGPLHILPAHSEVSVANLSGFAQLLIALGGDSDSLFAAHGVDPSHLQDRTHFIDCQHFVDLLESAATQVSDPMLGFRLAARQGPDVYGTVAALCRSADTLGSVIDCLIEYLPVMHSSESVLELIVEDDFAELRWTERSDMGVNDQATCQGLLLNLQVLQQTSGGAFVPGYVTVNPTVAGNITEEVGRWLACPIHSSRDYGCIGFSVGQLELPVVSADPALFRLLEGYCSRLRSSRTENLVDKVDSYISGALSSGTASIEGCAKKLGVSARTLQARLKTMDIKFSDKLESYRQEHAKRLLKTTDLSIAEVADRLGYSERTSFGRAFKRWTGVPPQQYR